MERIQKILSSGSYCSRRDAERLIEKGKVTVNGKVAVIGQKANFTDKFEVNGKPIKLKGKRLYYLVNKPKGYICSNFDKENRRVVDLVNTNDYLFTIGRLDVNTTGLIIVTNDGEFSRQIESPESHVPKTYMAKVDKIVSVMMKEKLEKGVTLESGYETLPLQYIEVMRKDKKTSESVVKVVLTEGKKNQVKEMFKAIGVNVINLTRIKIGDIKLGDTELGHVRKMTPEEVDSLKFYRNNNIKQ